MSQEMNFESLVIQLFNIMPKRIKKIVENREKEYVFENIIDYGKMYSLMIQELEDYGIIMEEAQ